MPSNTKYTFIPLEVWKENKALHIVPQHPSVCPGVLTCTSTCAHLPVHIYTQISVKSFIFNSWLRFQPFNLLQVYFCNSKPIPLIHCPVFPPLVITVSSTLCFCSQLLSMWQPRGTRSLCVQSPHHIVQFHLRYCGSQALLVLCL